MSGINPRRPGSPTATPTGTRTPDRPPTPTGTRTPTVTPTETRTPTPTITPSISPPPSLIAPSGSTTTSGAATTSSVPAPPAVGAVEGVIPPPIVTFEPSIQQNRVAGTPTGATDAHGRLVYSGLKVVEPNASGAFILAPGERHAGYVPHCAAFALSNARAWAGREPATRDGALALAFGLPGDGCGDRGGGLDTEQVREAAFGVPEEGGLGLDPARVMVANIDELAPGGREQREELRELLPDLAQQEITRAAYAGGAPVVVVYNTAQAGQEGHWSAMRVQRGVDGAPAQVTIRDSASNDYSGERGALYANFAGTVVEFLEHG